MKLALMTYPMVEEYLKSRKIIILPIGSTEQHSPYGLIGTDHIAAEEIAYKVGENTNIPVAPTLSYGMSNHHMGFKGTISINPSTFMLYIKDIITSLFEHGFKQFYFVNGHGGNVATVEALCSELTRQFTFYSKLISWWTMPEITAISGKLFGKKEGHHATPAEVSVTKYFYENHFKEIPKKLESPVDPVSGKSIWPLSPEIFKKIFPDGRMLSDPTLASFEHGKVLFEKAVETIEQDVLEFEKMTPL